MVEIECTDLQIQLRWTVPSVDPPSETASCLASHSNVVKSFSLVGKKKNDWKEMRRNEQERDGVIGNEDTSHTPRTLMRNWRKTTWRLVVSHDG